MIEPSDDCFKRHEVEMPDFNVINFMQQLSPAIVRTECASKHSDEDMYRCFRRKDLHFMHLNTRSLLPKIDELCHIATTTGAAIISVTWLDRSEADSEIEIPGYMIQRKDRWRTGGGVCIWRSPLAWISALMIQQKDRGRTGGGVCI